jgi:hypothetical protein
MQPASLRLANDPAENSRVRYMAASWVHEQASGKPKEYDPASEKPVGPVFDPGPIRPSN